MKIGALGIGAKSTEKAITAMNTIGPQTPHASTRSRSGSASNSSETPKTPEATK